jgi:hypothetical protein
MDEYIGVNGTVELVTRAPRPSGRFYQGPGFGRVCVWSSTRISADRAWWLIGSVLGQISGYVFKISKVLQQDGISRFDCYCNREREQVIFRRLASVEG